MVDISIIVPVYNVEKYIRQCLESLVNQTHKNIEIIVINDGSPDNSAEIIQQFVENDNRIIFIQQKNSGVSVARNRGMEVASGKWLTFVDGDDWVELNMCEVVLSKVSENNPDMAMWSYFKNFANSEFQLSMLPSEDKLFKHDKDLILLRSIFGNYNNTKRNQTVSAGTVWAKLYSREFIIENALAFNRNLTRAQDTIFNINAVSKAKFVQYFDIPLYHYRITETSTCSGSKYIENTKKPFNALLDEFELFISNYSHNSEYRSAYYSRVVQVLLWHMRHKYNNPNYKSSLFRKRREILSLINTEPYKEALRKVEIESLPRKEATLVRLFNVKLILTFLVALNLYEKKESKTKKF